MFDKTSFNYRPNFLYTSFYDLAVLRETEFKNGINLAYINLRDKGCLALYNETIGNMSNNSREDQETFRILKNEAQRKNDSIKAIDYYQKECESHRNSLSWFKNSTVENFSNKFVLSYEKIISNYGTSVPKSLFWIIYFNFLCFVYFLYTYSSLNFNFDYCTLKLTINGFFNSIIPGVFYGEDSFYKNASGVFKSIHLLGNVLLIYELQKSFRKYSRRL
ncbi:hypothetical protein [Francisella sp. 19S2-10]|uniref:hypothetical protein n=1 Tax=unclassified Francisella TaxID=2610885 RepID=UPI002E74FEA3|nr:hypothetical protein [Francisella sp. 19S2-4]MED7831029.1 hypothetical protein [Francisella sp. 19S2-10]